MLFLNQELGTLSILVRVDYTQHDWLASMTGIGPSELAGRGPELGGRGPELGGRGPELGGRGPENTGRGSQSGVRECGSDPPIPHAPGARMT